MQRGKAGGLKGACLLSWRCAVPAFVCLPRKPFASAELLILLFYIQERGCRLWLLLGMLSGAT